jgi:hypothetical protein
VWLGAEIGVAQGRSPQRKRAIFLQEFERISSWHGLAPALE